MTEQPSDQLPHDQHTETLPAGQGTPEALSSDEPAADEGLPEWEPLTPELVEDESIRGDFVMKWAVVMLAFLLGSTLIGEPTALVHVKTGQYLASHGFLPPVTDVFSNPANGRPWTNLSWLFDLVAAGVYGAGSWIGLGFFKALIAGITIGLVIHICRREVSTWWGSICATLAVLVCQPRFTPQPELVTLLGLALALWLLYDLQQEGGTRRAWWMVPMFFVWSNVDERMFLGLFLVASYAVGEACGQLAGYPGLKSAAQRRRLWQVLGLSIVAATIHPFTWKWVLSPATLFGTTYPAMRGYAAGPPFPRFYLAFFGAYDPNAFVEALDRSAVALFLLWGAALVTFVLNRKRLDVGHVFAFVGFTVLAVCFIHEWAAAAIVFCVIATLNGQAWHSATFARTYSVELPALVFSRGGRAATVVALFLIALLAVTDRWRGPSDGALGYGLDPALTSVVGSMRTQLEETFDDRPFNYSVGQGDILIWLDKQPFIDHRLSIYAGVGTDDLLDLHKQIRKALRSKKIGESDWGDSTVWKDAFDKYRITHVLPRLTFSPRPDYPSMNDLRSSPDWELASIGAAAALFYRKDLKDPELRNFVAEHKEDFDKLAFHDESSRIPRRDGWVQPPTLYQKYLWGARTPITSEVLEAVHLVQLAAGVSQHRAGLLYLALRRAQQGLAKEHNDPKGYLVLGDIYNMLAATERPLGPPQPNNDVASLRYYQAVMAYNQALIAAPNMDAAPHEALFRLYAGSQKWDLADRELKFVKQLLSRIKNPSKEEQQKLDECARVQERLDETLRRVDEAAARLEANGQTLGQLLAFYMEQGCVLRALNKFGEAGDMLGPDPAARSVRAMLLIEAGQIEEAYTAAGLLEAASAESGFQDWQRPRLLTYLANAEYDPANRMLLQDADRLEKTAMSKVLLGLPAVSIVQTPLPWPVSEISGAFDYFYQMPPQAAARTLTAALLEVEAGETQKAAQHFSKVLELFPETPERTLAVLYLYWLTGEEKDLVPPSQQVPVLFEPDEA